MKFPNYPRIPLSCALLTIVAVCGLGLSSSAQEVLTLKPSKDAFVRNGSEHRDSNFGSEPIMALKGGAVHVTRQVLIGFDLPETTATVERAMFVFAVVRGGKNTATVQVQHADSNWEENTVTWANKPVIHGPVMTIESPDGVVAVDVTAFLKTLPADARQLTFLLSSDPAKNETFKGIASKEQGHGSNSPMLLLRMGAGAETAQQLPAAAAAGPEPTPSAPRSAPTIVMSETFDQGKENPLVRRLLNHRHIDFAAGKGRGGSDAVRVAYVGYERGSERVSLPIMLKNSMEQATLVYDVMFDDDWQWVKTGKLHGLGPRQHITGGKERKPEGWSARVTFKKDGLVSSYLYDQDMSKRWGANDLSSGPVFKKNQWHRVVLQVSLNTVGKADGWARIYVDGKLAVDSKNVEFRGSGGPDSLIQKFLFSTFHGGNRPSDAPKDAAGNFTTVHAYFDNFVIYDGIFDGVQAP